VGGKELLEKRRGTSAGGPVRLRGRLRRPDAAGGEGGAVTGQSRGRLRRRIGTFKLLAQKLVFAKPDGVIHRLLYMSNHILSNNPKHGPFTHIGKPPRMLERPASSHEWQVLLEKHGSLPEQGKLSTELVNT
jgi:hypothetical protein